MTDQHTPLTDQQLDAYETAARNAARIGSGIDPAAVLELTAEVRRLRAELVETTRPCTPRLCACGHSHLSHTVPAPHSCFAFGQTCPCPAYRQLPYDDAVAQLERNRTAAAHRPAASAVSGAADSRPA